MRIWLQVIALLAALVPAAGWAQDIRWQFARFPLGSTVTYKLDSRYVTHLLAARDGQGARVEVYEGREPKGKLTATYWLNPDGRSVRHIDHDKGNDFRYAPHNCVRVVGTCTYRMTQNGGAPRQVTSVLTLTGKGFSYLITEGDRTVSSGYADLGPNGMNVKGYHIDSSGRRIEGRIVKVQTP